ncbi:MAG: hypothetical protein IKD27_09880 [Oscillospiraceae bacterium]|nr:hypothetical protein [Oscillospiraceae bacterium]
MQYTPDERARKLWALAENEPECAALQKEMLEYQEKLAGISDKIPFKLGKYLWACPTAIQLYYGRVIELALQEMRFPEESQSNP